MKEESIDEDGSTEHVRSAILHLRDEHGILGWGAEVDILEAIIGATRCYDKNKKDLLRSCRCLASDVYAD